MKYISNALLAVVIAVVINYIIVRVYSSKKKRINQEPYEWIV